MMQAMALSRLLTALDAPSFQSHTSRTITVTIRNMLLAKYLARHPSLEPKKGAIKITFGTTTAITYA